MYRPQGQQPPPAQAGSVRRARERIAAGLPPEMPPPPLPRARQPMPPALSESVKNQTPIGVAISRPSPAPQWPLPANPNIITFPDNVPQGAGRGKAPQRPPRPSVVPSMLDASRLTGPSPVVFAQAQNFNPNMLSPHPYDRDSDVLGTPMTASSRPSTVSSVGTIPDFPMPIPPRRSANLGPPPTSRRGASSYYSTASFVSPIPEESPRTLHSHSHDSYASSAAIPSSWGDESPRFYMEDGGFSDDEIMPDIAENELRESESRESSRYDDSDERQLVRQASVGRRGRPSVVTTKSAEDKRPGPTPLPIPMNKLAKMGVFGSDEMSAAARANPGGAMVNEDIARAMASPLASGTGFIDSTSSSEENITRFDPASETPSPANEKKSSPLAQQIPPSPATAPSRLLSMRRPPRLDMDAVRAQEQRGSLTSLPDLIKRATRLAALMENGKRPASRLNVFSGFFGGDDSERDREFDDEKHKSGLSDMLAAFPPPGLATPQREQSPGPKARPISVWPGPVSDASGATPEPSRKSQKSGRRCCGLPLWGFLALLLLLLAIIAAAVVVPLEILVIHKNDASTATTSDTLASCQSSLTCENGGTNILSSGQCTCLCINGFSGSTCADSGTTGCTYISVNANSTSVSNVTIGEAIPRLIEDSETNFTIPLDSSIVVSRFNAANLSCTSENALVTFDGSDERDLQVRVVAGTVDITTGTAVPTGIIVASSTQSSATMTTSTASPSATLDVTDNVLDFARVAVLYVLQEETFDKAIDAQTSLQKVFTSGVTYSSASNVSIGNGNTVNLVDLSIDVGNGTVGGLGSSTWGRR